MIETLQAAACDEKWVPSAERVKISSTNIRLETIVPQKEETFQVVIDIIKNSTCFKALTISTDVPEIFMQQFWYTIKKVQDTDSYEFLLANKKCIVNDEVFRRILNICPRVEGEDFMDVPDDETALTFLFDLGYKGLLNRHTNMFVDHMHQPWENIDNHELIWKDLAYQIDHRKEKRSRRKNMPYPRFTKIIINHFLKQHKSLTNLNHKHYHTIKDGGIVIRLKFVRIGEDYQEYGHPIPNVMLTEAIKHSESYQMFIKYLTYQIPPKKSRGTGSKGKKTAEESQETVDVSEESEPKPEPAKKKTASIRVVKKKVTLSVDDNIISDDLDAALELAKCSSLTPSEQEAANIMQALKESKKTSRRQPGTGGSNEGSGSKSGVPYESIVISATSSDGTGAKLGVANEDKDITEEKVILEWGDEQDSKHSDDDNDDAEKDEMDGDDDDEGDDHVSDKQDDDDEDDETESDEDDIYKCKIRVRKDEDVELKDVKVKGPGKGDEEITDAAKEEVEKTSEAKDDTKKSELPPSSSSLSISLGFGDQFLKLSSDSSLVSTVKDSADVDVSSLLDIPIQHKTPQIQSPSVQKIPVAKLEKDVSELKTGDHSSVALAVLQSYVPTVVDSYLDTKHLPELTKKLTPTTEQESEITLKEYDLKSALYQSMHANKSFNRNPANHRLYHTLMEALIKDENAMDKGVADTVKDHKRKHDDDEDDDDEDPPVGPNQDKNTKMRRTKESESSNKPTTTKETPKGKTLTKGSKTGKSALAKEPVEEPITEMIMNDVGDDVVRDDDQPQATSKPKTSKTLNPEWFKQPSKPPTPDPEWNKCQVVLDQPAQPWFNQMVSASKDPLTFNNLMATPIDFYNHRTVAVDYFFNNDLEYLKTSDPEVTYTTSITKTKAAWYEIKGIKDIVPTLWSTIKHAYNEDALIRIKHWGKRRKLWYRSHLNKFSKQYVYATKAILGVKSDMLLLAVQHKLFHLDGNVIVDFIMDLRMFTRSLILKRCVEDLHLGVESYQNNLNITKPQKTFLEIESKEPYTPSYDPPGIEHPSDTLVFTVKMEILLEPTSNKLLVEFDIEIKDKKGTKNVAANYLSRIENDETSDDDKLDDNFPGETFMEISTKDIPWFTYFANYLVGDIIPKGMTYQQKNKFFSDLKNYFWEDPYLFKVCSDGLRKKKLPYSEVKVLTGKTATSTVYRTYVRNKSLQDLILPRVNTAEGQKMLTLEINKHGDLLRGVYVTDPIDRVVSFVKDSLCSIKGDPRNNGVRNSHNNALAKPHAQTREKYEIWKSGSSVLLRSRLSDMGENDVKARSLLLMALLNEHQLTFNQYVDAQSMFVAIKARFGGNEATKRTQKALLKQQYENFNASSSESLDSIFNRLQKLVSRLAILGVVTPPEDLNVKFLRSLPLMDTHARLLVMINQRWNVSTAIKWDILPENAKHQRVKTTEIGIKSDMAEEEIQANMALMAFSDSEDYLGLNFKRLRKKKEGFKFKIAKFEKSSKDLDQLLASQITDKSKKGFGYNDVPSPHPLILNRPTPLDLSYSGLQEFKQTEVNEYGPRDSSVMPTTGCDKELDNSKENTDDSLKQQQKTDSSLVKSPLKVDKDWKEKFFCPANQVREEEPKKARENNDAPIIWKIGLSR
ncbi:hypothetical protein Tco_1108335 [Tanacetum coccineum]